MLLVVVGLVAVLALTASYVWITDRQQRVAGHRYASTAALALAEAGIHRALWHLEHGGPVRAPWTWRSDGPRSGAGADPGLPGGVVRVDVEPRPDGTYIITSEGQAGGHARRLLAVARFAPVGLRAGLFTAGTLYLAPPPAAIHVTGPLEPWSAPWVHVGVGDDLWLGSMTSAFNRSMSAVPTRPATGTRPARHPVPSPTSRPLPVRVLARTPFPVTVGSAREPLLPPQLANLGFAVRRFPAGAWTPVVDWEALRRLALANEQNAELNHLVGRWTGDTELAAQRTAQYTHQQFQRIALYLHHAGASNLGLRGPVAVEGVVELPARVRVAVTDGALLIQGGLFLNSGAAVEISHGLRDRQLPGLIVLGSPGTVHVGAGGLLRADGLVLTDGPFVVDAAGHAEVVGALVSRAPDVGIRNFGTLVVRYDPAVPGTVGVRPGAPGAGSIWVERWEDVR